MPWLTSSRGRARTVALLTACRFAGTAQVHARTAVDAAVSGAVRTGATVASARSHAHRVQEPRSMTPTAPFAITSVAGGPVDASGVTTAEAIGRATPAAATLVCGLVLDEADVEIMLTAVRR